MRWGLVVVSVALVSAAEAAPGRLVTVEVPPQPLPRAGISPVLVMERCTGGCTVTHGATTAATDNVSTIPQSGGTCADINAGCTISEFVNAQGQTGADADVAWNALVQCVREVYSPFEIEVTDVRPVSGTYHLAIAAGNPGDVGLAGDILGIAPLTQNCTPIDNTISFSFANHHPAADPQRTYTMCWTVTQESAHAFGLDHAFEFTDGTSTCNDPMTYRTDCGGQRFFRNHRAVCGTYAEAPCRCGGTQNSHQKLLSVFGEGASIVPPPTVELTLPNPTSPMLGAVAGARARSDRGVAKVQLVLNDSVYAEVKGAPFGPQGQDTGGQLPSYTLPIPPDLPDSKYTVVVRACDDLDLCTETTTFEGFKGVPSGCRTDSTGSDGCLAEQTCDTGYCRYPSPVGEVGDGCTYAQYCKSNVCAGTADHRICTQACELGDACPGGLSCVVPGDAAVGICFAPEDSGCCTVAGRGAAPWPYFAVPVGLFAMITRRRRSLKSKVSAAVAPRDENC